MDISLMIDEVKYNFRVGAVLQYKDKVLIEQGDIAPFCVIPGGRVKILEDTISALNREIKEELGIDISNLDGELISVIENFFTENGVKFHELYFIYKYNLIEDYGIKDGMLNLDSLRTKYYWKELNEFENLYILPTKLKEVVKLDSFKKYIVK